MRTVWLTLGMLCSLAALFFNTTNALHMWGFIGAFFAVVAFPIMFLVVPITLLINGELPLYWLLVPAMTLFLILGLKD